MTSSAVSVIESQTQLASLSSTVATSTSTTSLVTSRNKNEHTSKSMKYHFSVESRDFTGSSLKKLGAALEIAYRIFCNRGELVLAEKYTYPAAIEAAGLVGVRFEGVEMDGEGLRADSLHEILKGWDSCQGPKPHLLYTVPTGQNPTGTTQSAERRQAIYNIAEEHDLIIIEDDPYYFLRMGVYQPGQETFVKPSSELPSYLSLDRSGRVVRLDSTAKVLAPGLRAGWVTANAHIIEKFIAYQEITTVAVTKGMLFAFNQKPNGELQFRLTFAAAPVAQLEEAVKVFGGVVKEVFGLTLA
ncbi:hypothetical protein BBP40_011907 [Aspergillus hancockii]|nr:hypothetical protein BBP40_011907 [Aspergillus hancockii]